tara:strand:+ start:65 stop:418 length:354 start_codon:yes stop_codon:yes gene_type:complete
MAHFAKVNQGLVVEVIVADQDYINNMVDTSPGTWIQTSYNTHGGVHSDGGTPLRKNFAGVGNTYDADRDAFYDPKPYPSWTLNSTTFLWECPVATPEDYVPENYSWNETDQSWDAVE